MRIQAQSLALGFLAVQVLAFGFPATVHSQSLKDDAGVIEAIDLLNRWIDAQRAYEQIPGLSVVIVHDQELLWSAGFGYADLDSQRPATPGTMCSICCTGSTEVRTEGDALRGTTTTPVATTVTILPASLGLSSFGEAQQRTPTIRDQNGLTMGSASVTCLSSLTSVASVSSGSLVTAASNGAATITATSGSASGTAEITVQQVAASITVSPSAVVLAGPGATVTVTASGMDAGSAEIANPNLTWSSGDIMNGS